IRINLWNYYKRDLSVKSIMDTAKVLEYYGTNELTDRSFPVDTDYNFSYQSNWGDRRGFGGNRIHEGTDVFADYGTPVTSTTYGVVELKGWNLYGGWRIGVRDIYNIYHYYAHLQQYADDIKVGDIVKPGDVLGNVGSSGYGPPGTSGKFPPHLHYGMYKDNGINEFSFDPYPYLMKWERMENESGYHTIILNQKISLQIVLFDLFLQVFIYNLFPLMFRLCLIDGIYDTNNKTAPNNDNTYDHHDQCTSAHHNPPLLASSSILSVR